MARTKKAPKPTPILDALIAAGTVRIVDTDLIGIASDGTEVSLGMVELSDRAERYLEANPTPDMW